jgi:hypothetical protein
MGSIIGGTIAGVAAFSIALVLFIWLRRRARPPRKFVDTEKMDTQNLVYAPLDLPQGSDASANHPIATNTGHYAPPLNHFHNAAPYAPPVDRFLPEIRDDSGGTGRLAFTTLMAVSPLAADRFAQLPIHVPDCFPGPTIGAGLPVMPVPYPVASSSTYPSVAPYESKAASTTETTDADTSSPRSDSPSISSTSAFLPRLARPLRDNEVQAAADLLRQGPLPVRVATTSAALLVR